MATFALICGWWLALNPPATEPAVQLPGIEVRAIPPASGGLQAAGAIHVRRVVADAVVEPFELLHGVPGVVVRDRGNPAQEPQVLVRGSGGRASFGIRGVRLLLDGLPLDAADGQGQLANVPIELVERVETYRGPSSQALSATGNGVIAFYTVAAPAAARVQADDSGLVRASLSLSPIDDTALHLSHAQGVGWRPHSAFQRDQIYLRRVWPELDGGSLAVVANLYRLPVAEDPLGQTLDDYRSGNDRSAELAQAFETRKQVAADLLGATWASQRWIAAASLNRREVEQYLAVPLAAQASPTSAGGVIAFTRHEGSVDVQRRSTSDPLAWSASVELRHSLEQRAGYENQRDGRLGQRGRLRRDELNRYQSARLGLRGEYQAASGTGAHVSLGAVAARLRTDDRYIQTGNPDDSGTLHYSGSTAGVGLHWPLAGGVAWLSIGRGLELPTQTELAYRPDGLSGLNRELAAPRRNELELGWRSAEGSAELVGYYSQNRDEISPVSNEGGRTRFANLGGSRRYGLELLWQRSGPDWGLGVSAAWQRALSQQDQRSRRIPAVAQLEGQMRGSRTLHQAELYAEIDVRSAMFADDANRLRVPGHGLLHLGLEHSMAGTGRLGIRVSNVLDQQYVGSLIVNEARGRVVEPGRGRAFLLTIEQPF